MPQPQSELCDRFVREVLLGKVCWGERTNHFLQLCNYWTTAQKVIEELNLPPSEWSDHRNLIYQYFRKRRLSVSYAQKVIRVLNLWGRFYSRRTNTFYEEVPKPRGEASVKIQEAYFEKRPHGLVSKALSWEQLKSVKDKMLIENWNWLYLTLWFGLRPSELNNLKWGIEEYKGVMVLAVFQHKLVRIPTDQRWKFIPILFEEQRAAIDILVTKNYRVPLVKTLRRHIGPRVTLRAGRKGFVALMWEQGKYPKEVSYRWLGHKSVRTTNNHYTQGIQQACEF